MPEINAFDLLLSLNPSRLSFSCEIIDSIIGGIHTRGITEISGEAGSGKTQIGLFLSLQCQLPIESGGLDGSTAYLSCGEGEFPIKRLHQMTHAFQAQNRARSTTDYLSNIHIHNCHTSDDLFEAIQRKIPSMCKEKHIKLLVIDSIAGIFRTEFDTSDQSERLLRTDLLFQVSKGLRWLSDVFGVCVLVLNQVSSMGGVENRPIEDPYCASYSLPSSFTPSPLASLSSSSPPTPVPALGLVWSTCINTRILLERDSTHLRGRGTGSGSEGLEGVEAVYSEESESGDQRGIEELMKQVKEERASSKHDTDTSCPPSSSSSSSSLIHRSLRRMTLVFSPTHPSRSCYYEILSGGIRGIT